MVSAEAKALVKKMLKFNPKERISAEEALNDPWVQQMCTKSELGVAQNKISLTNLQTFRVHFALLPYI
jgi:calcium-dependent protein kinase